MTRTPRQHHGALSLLLTTLALGAAGCPEPTPVTPPLPTTIPTIPPPPTATATATATGPVVVNAPPGPKVLRGVSAIGAGAKHACALTGTTVACWGANDRGQLGSAEGSSALARPVPDVAGAVELAVSPGNFACVRREDGAVTCWGEGSRSATKIANVEGATQIAASEGTHACAVLRDGTARCWTMGDAAGAKPVAGLRDVAQIAVREDHTCARLTTGAVKCWGGDNCAGELGDGTRTARAAPVSVVDLPKADSIALGRRASCAVLPNHAVACWGAAGWSCKDASVCAEPGAPAGCGFLSSPRPKVVRGVTQVAELSKGNLGCMLFATHTVACWDWTGRAETFPGEPHKIEGITDAASVAVGEHHACALLGDGSVRCWGENDAGQLGNGVSGAASPAPVPVMRAP